MTDILLETLKTHLLSRGVDPDKTKVIMDEENGIATFLLYNLSGQLVGYQRYNPSGDKKDHTNSLEAKYYSYITKESDKASKLAVWGLEDVYIDQSFIFVTEGIFDAIKIKNAGYPAIAMLTNDPKPLKGWFMAMNKIVIAILDNDDGPGNKLAKIANFSKKTPDPYKDLGDMPQDEATAFLKSTYEEFIKL